MANGNGGDAPMTKADLENCVDRATEILSDAYQPESDRETLAVAIGNALDALSGDDTDEDEDDDSDDHDQD